MDALLFPDPFIHQLSLYLSLDEIIALCLTNANFNNIICKTDYTWQSRFIQEFGPITYEGSWRDLYKTTFKAFVSGSNLEGQLSLNTTQNVKSFTPINDIMYKQIAMGDSHTLFLDLNGNVSASGNNRYGQLGLGDRNIRLTATIVPGIRAKKIAAGAIIVL